MPISSDQLNDGEEVLVDMRPHWIFFTGPALLTVLALAAAITLAAVRSNDLHWLGWILLAMVAIPAGWLAFRIGRWLGMSLVITNHRILVRRGVFGRDITQLRIQRVTEVHMNQSLIERIVGSGQLVLDVQGGEADVTVDDVRRPRSLQRVLTNQLDRYDQPDTGLPRPSAPPMPGAGLPTGARGPMQPPLPIDQGPTPPHGVPRSFGPPVATPPTATPPVVHPPIGGPPVVTPPVAPAPAASGNTVAEQLIALDDLRRRGIVTDQEFQSKKAELLHRL